MKSLKFLIITILLVSICFGFTHESKHKKSNSSSSIENDTITISKNNVNTKVLKEGTNRYLVYFKKGANSPRSDVWFWTREIKREKFNGKDAIIINQVWEGKDTIMHTVKSVSDLKTMQSLYSTSWWKGQGRSTYDFVNKTATIDDVKLSDNDTDEKRLKSWNAFKKSWDTYTLNWHLDLEVFSILPYKENTTFLIPYYDPGFSAPKNGAYTVTESAKLEAYDNQLINCWLLEHTSKNNKETFWISKETKEVLKLEQEMAGGRFFRYKIKLGFSN